MFNNFTSLIWVEQNVVYFFQLVNNYNTHTHTHTHTRHNQLCLAGQRFKITLLH